MKLKFKNINLAVGPGSLVAAAFIGPGTVTVCTLAGVNFGFELLWALLLSIIATIILQEMAARIGLVTQKGLANILKDKFTKPLSRFFALGLVLMAIVMGNAAYEAGNISGGAMGVELVGNVTLIPFAGFTINIFSLLIGVIAGIFLFLGNYKSVESFMIILVIMMSISFVTAAILTKPFMSSLWQGFIPSLRSDNILTIVALVGTTVVPYNLFLHSSLIAKRWNNISDLKTVRIDTVISIVLGGMISMAILITAAASQAQEINSAKDLALGLTPIYGEFGKYMISIGLFAAGITSAMTAPLAAALVVTGCFGWSQDVSATPMRIIMGCILIIGLFLASLGIKPIELITFAQLANGILLPLITAYILYLVNQKNILGQYRNRLIHNILGFGIWIITFILGTRSIMKVLENWL